jgi:hypothetical protein
MGKGNEAVIKEYAAQVRAREKKDKSISPVEGSPAEESSDGIPPNQEVEVAPPPHWMPDWLKKIVLATLEWGWIGVPVAAILELIRKWLVNAVRDRQTERAIKKVIDHFYESTKPPDGVPSNYRVTLFKFRKFSCTQLVRLCVRKNRRNPWKGWLAPYERSGAHRNRTNVRWAASLDDMHENDGVVGKIFRDCTAIRIERLPATEELRKSAKRRKEYADGANCSDEWVLNKANGNGSLPRSFWGTTVEISGGAHPWGVLLIDSNLPDLIEAEVIENESRMVLKMLSIMLSPEKR